MHSKVYFFDYDHGLATPRIYRINDRQSLHALHPSFGKHNRQITSVKFCCHNAQSNTRKKETCFTN
jgi:hypothetical protein